MIEQMCGVMKNQFCQPEAGWVIIMGKPLRLNTRQMHPIAKSWESFIVQTLESASNQSKFIVKRCIALMAILNHEPVDVGLLIAKVSNTWMMHHKYFVDIFVLVMNCLG